MRILLGRKTDLEDPNCLWLWLGRKTFVASSLKPTGACKILLLGQLLTQRPLDLNGKYMLAQATNQLNRGLYDFFLISQLTRQGSVNPTYYNVVYDDNGLKPDHMQRLTYKMCHLYYNWTGLIRVPAPCQYANKLTFLVGQSIHREPSLELADKLFYL
ncbi:hypothetical protein JD844_033417 [Phrynosoma platyrhinos]|uniref:Piwi domain-containing protein n=1 Tax=Phrynosoma platyrhinos TaxID=52577 RepID=A0ABQ7T730_PHRPL|nr:hypothetical protein JD844_033417 [Phrynosoma platyrhinos]